MTVPDWVKDAVFYQIFPDRFRNGDSGNDPANVQQWGSNPTIWDFQGGDLEGVLGKIDYLSDLGINAIYFNPIFQASSNHRYNTSDYYRVDPNLGGNEVFLALLESAHKNDIRVVIDGVFNHCGRGFFAFNDVLENQGQSSYVDWFHINKLPLDAYSPGDALDYEAWWKYKSLPKFNTDNPRVRNYIFDVARYWIRLGADGWRLDVPNEIDDDSFWEEFRNVVKSENPEAYLVGEIWDGDPNWVGEKRFDGLMNYPLREGIIGLLMGLITIDEFSQSINNQLNRYDQDNVFAMYNPLGSHDTERIKTALEGKVDKLKLAYQILLAFPGAPAIYYGDEIGLDGGKDPDCRKAFPWDENEWDGELRNFIRRLISIRKKRQVMRQGTYHEILVDAESNGYSFARILENESLLVILNTGDSHQNYQLPVAELDWKDGRIVQNEFSGDEFIVSGSKLNISLDPWQGFWLV